MRAPDRCSPSLARTFPCPVPSARLEKLRNGRSDIFLVTDLTRNFAGQKETKSSFLIVLHPIQPQIWILFSTQNFDNGIELL